MNIFTIWLDIVDLRTMTALCMCLLNDIFLSSIFLNSIEVHRILIVLNLICNNIIRPDQFKNQNASFIFSYV